MSLHWPHHRTAYSNCKDTDVPDKEKYLQGGTLQTLHGRHSGRLCHHHTDSLGRWSVQTLRLRNNKKLAIITAYRPCKMQINAGSNTVVTQQWKQLRKKNISQHPRSRFLYDLKMLILELQLNNTEIILGMDANLSQPINPEFMFQIK